MTLLEHTFGPECRLAPLPALHRDDDVPPLEAQYFYSSSATIDDPTWANARPEPAAARSNKTLLRPFGRGDNNELEKTWRRLMSKDDRDEHERIRSSKKPEERGRAAAGKRDHVVRVLSAKHQLLHQNKRRPDRLPTSKPDDVAAIACCSKLEADIVTELQLAFCSQVRATDPMLQPAVMAHDIVNFARPESSSSTPKKKEGKAMAMEIGPPADSHREGMLPPPLPSTPRSRYLEGEMGGRSRSLSQATNRSTRAQTPSSLRQADGITGLPFVRAAEREERAPSPASQTARARPQTPSDAGPSEALQAKMAELEQEETVKITVGVSKLHVVVLPSLQMKPIYWSPVNDVAAVTRATWFYRDTMLPVSPAVANQLEAGFQEMRPWTETWRDEVRCAVDIGPDGEEKLAHPLWPTPTKKTVRLTDLPVVSDDPFCSSHCSLGDAASQGSITVKSEAPSDENRPFASYQVIYKDAKHAFLLKPSLQPSAYYGRRPVYGIAKGFTIGVPVVRGFDRTIWNRYSSGKLAKPQTEREPEITEAEAAEPTACSACHAEQERGQITDLVLVAHGIGQKIAERVESYHFTHAINNFRRAVNADLHNPAVKKVLRDGYNGLMILPLNWRMGLSFDHDEIDESEQGKKFALKDIEPRTIPSIRSMISDVMFDIPFYMSHHKGKMINSLIYEANRVYRLWCLNNPGFAGRGKVHMLAHSLGSVMAVDILSRQPTYVPPLDLKTVVPSSQFFEFDTHNLFLLGSPAGFFLLLERGALLPRRDRAKPGADPADTASESVTGEAGQFGCVAVDNVYNVLAKEDPIAYLLTGAVDSAYAAGLKTAFVPSSAPSMLASMGNAVRQVVPGMTPAPDPLAVEPERPAPARLPSQLELEVHNFTREEIAERKAFLLNDNGQIDWFLRSGGGPLEIQYLNMLSAHTSYWTNHDFIRMICLELGRKQGRANTFPAMRAVKASKRVV